MAEEDYEWLKRRRKITYRNHTIEVLVQRRVGGHRHQVHQYAGFNTPYAETFGLRAGTYTFDAVVTGTDYDKDLAALEAVLKKPGRGRLTLWHGPDRFVICRRWRISELAAEAGYAKVTIEFVDAGRVYAPSSSAGRSLLDSTLDDLKLAGLQAWGAVAGDSLAEFDELATQMAETATQAIVSVEGGMHKILQATEVVSDLATKISRFRTNVASWATDVFAVGTALVDVMEELAALPGDFKNTFTSLLDLVPWGRSLEPVTSPSLSLGPQARANQAGYASLMAQLAVSAAAETALQIEFASSQEAAELRDVLAVAMDEVILDAAETGADAVHVALREIKAIAMENLDAKAARLPTRVDLTFFGSVPSLVLSHRLYGTHTRAEELVARNQVRHPGFMPAGEPIDVLAPLETGRQ